MLQQTVPRIEALRVKNYRALRDVEIARRYTVVCLFGGER